MGRLEVDDGAATTRKCRTARGTILRDYGAAFATICARIGEAGDGKTTRDNQHVGPCWCEQWAARDPEKSRKKI